MKKFITQLIIFSFFACVLSQGYPIYLIITEKYKVIVKGYEIYHSIEKSKKKNKSRKLILGDSVGRQLFDNYTNNDTVNSLACNSSIGMVGQYILLNNYLTTGNVVDTVFLIYTPFYFNNNLDQVYTFHYFIKPFYNAEYIPYFSETVLKQIQKIPYHNFYWIPGILTSNWAPDFIPPDKNNNFTFLSPISIEYLKRIQILALKYNFKFIILPTPIRESRKFRIEKFDKREILNNGFENEFTNYFENIIYLNDSDFIDKDHVRYPKIYTKYYKNKFVK